MAELDDTEVARQLDAEHERIRVLEKTIRSWQRKLGQLQSKEAALETNLERLYTAAKRKVAEQDEALRAARRQRTSDDGRAASGSRREPAAVRLAAQAPQAGVAVKE